MKTEQLVPAIVRALRGTRTQGQVNRKLGFAYNQLSRWETGKKAITWRDWVRLCKVCEAPLAFALADCFSYPGDSADSRQVFLYLIDPESAPDAADRLGITPRRMARIIQGSSKPTTLEIFTALEKAGPPFLAFLYQLTGGRGIPALSDQMKAYQVQTELFFKSPWLSLVAQVMTREDYRSLPEHSDEWVSRESRLALSIVRSLREAMESAGLVSRKGDHYDVHLDRFSPRGDAEQRKRGFLFWNALIFEGIQASYSLPFSRASWDVVNLSESGYQKVLDHWKTFLGAIASVAEADQDLRKRTFLMCSNLFDVGLIPTIDPGFVKDFADSRLNDR